MGRKPTSMALHKKAVNGLRIYSLPSKTAHSRKIITTTEYKPQIPRHLTLSTVLNPASKGGHISYLSFKKR